MSNAAASAATTAAQTTTQTSPPAAAGQAGLSVLAVGASSNSTPTTAASATAATSAGTQTAPDWMHGFDDDTKGWVQNKGYKNPADLVMQTRNLEKLIGQQDKIVKMPDRKYTDDGKMTPEYRAVLERLGAPKEAKDYALEAGDPALTETFKNVFHERGIPKEDAEYIAKKWDSYAKDQATKAQEAQASRILEQQQKLRSEWGSAYDEKVRIAQEAFRLHGFTAKEASALSMAMGEDNALKMFHSIGTKTGEAKFIAGQQNREVTTVEGARARLAEKKADSGFVKRYLDGDADAVAEMTNLMRLSNPGEHRL